MSEEGETEPEIRPLTIFRNFARISPAQTCYEVLEVQPTDSAGVIKKAYYVKQKQNMSGFSVNSDDQAKLNAQVVNAAYEILSDPLIKEAYDKYLTDPAAFEPDDAESVHSADHGGEGENEADPLANFATLYPETMLAITTILERLNVLEEKGFDWRAYWEKYPHYVNRSLLGQSVKNGKILESLSAAGFVLYQIRSLFFQKLYNIILLGIGGGSTCLIPEFVMIFVNIVVYLVIYHFYAKDDFSNPKVGWLRTSRMILYPLEAGLLIATLAVATEEDVSSVIGFFVGLPNFWVCLILFLANKKKGANYQSAADRGLLKRAFPDFIFLLDATMNGILSRAALSLTSFVAVFWVAVGLLRDLAELCQGEESRNRRRGEETCHGADHLKQITSASKRWIVSCSHNKMFNSFNQSIDENYDVYTLASYYAMRILLFQLKNLVNIGEWYIYRQSLYQRFQQQLQTCHCACPPCPALSSFSFSFSLPSFRFSRVPATEETTEKANNNDDEKTEPATTPKSRRVEDGDIETGLSDNEIKIETIIPPEGTPETLLHKMNQTEGKETEEPEPESETEKLEDKTVQEEEELKNIDLNSNNDDEKTQKAENNEEDSNSNNKNSGNSGSNKKPLIRREIEDIDL